ncbi:hypothetical protein EPN15_03395 [Patescibacteria group bacterium]|nr:MAG: hypothetical protein EPN15_03395 [Patescibacteria group bacterium]
MRNLIRIFFIAVLLSIPVVSFANVGVGVGLGKIEITEKLSPGGIYKLNSIPVLNTGDEAGAYEVAATFMADQKESRPKEDWFIFDPKTFELAPGESKSVSVTMTLPMNAKPGAYFAFLEAHPTAKKEGVSIGVAAATKLYFTVAPKGVLGAFTARASSLLNQTAPGSFIVLAVLGILALAIVFQKFFKVSFNIKRKK